MLRKSLSKNIYPGAKLDGKKWGVIFSKNIGGVSFNVSFKNVKKIEKIKKIFVSFKNIKTEILKN